MTQHRNIESGDTQERRGLLCEGQVRVFWGESKFGAEFVNELRFAEGKEKTRLVGKQVGEGCGEEAVPAFGAVLPTWEAKGHLKMQARHCSSPED